MKEENGVSEHVSVQTSSDHDEHHYYPRGHHLVDTVGDLELTPMPPYDGETARLEEFHDEPPQLLQQKVQQQHESSGGDEGDGISSHHIGSARTPWYGTTIVLLSEVMGTGILSLPYAAKTLGWVSAMVAVPFFAALACYSGWLLARVQRELPSVHSYADASTELLGERFGRFTKVCLLLSWGALAVYYLIAMADGIQDFLGSRLRCSYQRSMVAALLLVLPCQCRDFYAISKYLSIPSTCAIVLLVLIVMGSLLGNGNTTTSFGDTTTIGPIEGTNSLDYLQALSAFNFAYQGQSIYLELMSEMKDSTQFPRSCNFAYVVMAFVYAVTVVVAYGLRGIDTPDFLPDILPPGFARSTVGLLVVLHIAVSYVVSVQPLHMWFHSTIFPKTATEESLSGKGHWFVLTFGYLIFGFFVGNLIPFFADVQALIGSLFGAPTIFAWPAAFYFALYRRKANSWKEACEIMGWKHAITCLLFLFMFTPIFWVLGTSGAVASIVQDAKNSLRPFECD